MKIRTRLIASAGVSAALAAAVPLYVYLGVADAQHTLRRAAHEEALSAELVQITSYVSRGMKELVEVSLADVDRLDARKDDEFRAAERGVTDSVRRLREHVWRHPDIIDEEDRAAIERLADLSAELYRHMDTAWLNVHDHETPARTLEGPIESTFEALMPLLGDLSTRLDERAQQNHWRQDRTLQVLRVWALSLAGMGLLVTIGLSVGVGRSVNRALRGLAHGASRLADGELGVTVPTGGPEEIATVAAAFNRMSAKLTSTVETLQEEIAQRRRVEKELRLTQFAVDHFADTALWVTPDARIVYANDAACEQLGYSREELSSMVIHDIDPSLPRDEWTDNWRAVRERRTFTLETHIRTKSGATFPVEVVMNHFEFEGQEYNCTIARNIADRKRLEEELRQAQKMEAVGRLAGGIAHDFNNLMMVVDWNCDLLLAELGSSEEALEHTQEIKRAGEQAAKLTRQLLAFGRKQVLRPRVLDLNPIVTEIGKMLERIVGEHVDLLTIPSDQPAYVKADQGQLQQILMNLASNASDAMPGGGRLTVEVGSEHIDDALAGRHHDVEAGPYEVISVTDNGHGMDQLTASRIFEPFFTTKDVGEGTGLGLSIVYSIVQQGGGHVRVYSEPGHGTAIRIYFPRAVNESDMTSNLVTTSAIDLSGSETILLVEDESTLRVLMNHALTGHGYTVLTAENGRDALQTAATYPERIDVLVSDLIMPEMGGCELAKRIKPERTDIKVLFISGYPKGGVSRLGLLDCDEPILAKPCSPQDLLREIRRVLDTDTSHDAVA